MAKIYDDWERLLAAVLKREEFRRLALCPSLTSSSSVDSSSRFSLDLNGPLGTLPIFSIPSYSDARPMLLKDLKRATRNFRYDFILGSGGFGTVYKGWVQKHSFTATKPGHGMAIAVKKWDPFSSSVGREEWLAEINYLNRLRHPNLIKLIGYCSEEDGLFLVYEFMAKGSLDNHLFKKGNVPFPWATRVKVAKGTARALAFLHNRETPVIHRGLRSADILLDNEYNALLSDFGLAKDGPSGEMTHVSTVVRGRSGFAAPEYITTGHLTTKCDVFGFGVLLLELLSGLHGVDAMNLIDKDRKIDKYWVKTSLAYQENEMEFRNMDPKLGGQYSESEACVVATVALHCLCQDPKLRPGMDEVLAALDPL